MRLIIILLLTLTLIPTASLAENKRVIDIYQQQLEDLRIAQAKLNALSKEAANRAAHIKQLITKYEAALKTATQDMEDKHEAQLKQLKAEHAKTEASYLKKLEAAAELAEYHYQSAKKTDAQIKSLLTELGMSAKQIIKLTEANSALQREVSALQREVAHNRTAISAQQREVKRNRTANSALQREVKRNRNTIREASLVLRIFRGHTSAVNSVAFSPDGRYALSGSSDKTLMLWDVSTGP